MADFPLAKFRIIYPAFTTVDDEIVLAIAEEAKCFIDAYGCACSDAIWMAVVAHMLALRAAELSGGAPAGALSGATIDKVSVSFHAPARADAWSYWLNTTPYGQKAGALMAACRSAGLYAGGLPERDAFTSVYGVRGGFRR